MSSKRLLDSPQSRLFSRELSWLAFNERVLDEAADVSNPLLERMKFLAIVSSNLEEFFMIRLAALYRQMKKVREEKIPIPHRDGFRLDYLLERIHLWVFHQKTRQARIFEDIASALREAGLHIENAPSELAEKVFQEQVLPHVAPVKILDGSILPHVRGSRLYLLARHSKSRSLVEIPSEIPRFITVKSRHVFMVDRLISMYRDSVFKQEVHELLTFKVSRDAEIVLDDDSEDPLKEIEAQIQTRDFGPIVRLEVDSLSLSDSVRWLQKQLHAPLETLYQLSLPLDLKSLLALHNMKGFKKLKYSYPEPRRPEGLPAGLSSTEFFRSLDRHEYLLHHPYIAFDPVVELVQNAAQDPSVTRICQTLYRTSSKSPILESLMEAAKSGKKVTALIELKARFDEANNIRLARALEKAGARVIYSTPDLKVHAKLTLVERKTSQGLRRYVHVSTGNYHPRTARLYTDLALITTQDDITADAKNLFDSLEALDERDELSLTGFKSWVVAPYSLHEQVIRWIDNEAEHARTGRPCGIRAKMNGLVEESVIEALYRASQAGVKVDLIVRGMCCLRPGVPGLSENIRVRSIVDKYLEHSRYFIFENGGERQVWLSSADWMPRNFFRRIELAVPVHNPQMKEFLSSVVWAYHDRENQRARECDQEGLYHKLSHGSEPPFRSQLAFEQLETPRF